MIIVFQIHPTCDRFLCKRRSFNSRAISNRFICNNFILDYQIRDNDATRGSASYLGTFYSRNKLRTGGEDFSTRPRSSFSNSIFNRPDPQQVYSSQIYNGNFLPSTYLCLLLVPLTITSYALIIPCITAMLILFAFTYNLYTALEYLYTGLPVP